MKEYKCCNKANYVKAYVICPLFECKYCLNCGEVIMDCDPISTFIFKWILAPFWSGKVKVKQ